MKKRPLWIVVVVAIVFILSGCIQTPPAIQIAHETEWKAIVACAESFKMVVDAYDADLRIAQIQHLEDAYDKMIEGSAVDGSIALEKLKDLTKQYREQRTTILTNLEAQKEKVMRAERNFDFAKRLNRAISGYLNRRSVTPEDVTLLMNAVAEVANEMSKPGVSDTQ